MAQRIVLHYFPANSPLHRWDARCKFLGLLIVTVSLLQFKTLLFIFNSGIILCLLILSRLPLRQFLRDFRIWAIVLSLLFLFQAFFSSGPRLSSLPWLPVSREGLISGGMTIWRLGLILVYAVLFTAVTRPRELRDALIWLLKPVPFLPEHRIGLMVSLTLHFFSLTLDQAEEVRLAHRSRLGDQRKNPIRKAKFLALPILRRSFFRAEEVTVALFARGFHEDLTLRLPKISPSHLIPLPILLGVAAVLWFLSNNS
ncbi:MAG: hypothetical protein A2169_14115 [Deltaproteobacteria bacterium RBG_13_47_9]|nr:MAG: hypothetical protein A2169_14115 [Deltaproteobacteria bacterium RBG_13_47_9]